MSKRKNTKENVSVKKAKLTFTDTLYTNFKLIVEGKELYIIKNDLMRHSDVFCEMLSMDQTDTLELKNEKYQTVLDVFQILDICNDTRIINDENLGNILMFAHKYNIKYVLEKCVEYEKKYNIQTAKMVNIFADCKICEPVIIFLHSCIINMFKGKKSIDISTLIQTNKELFIELCYNFIFSSGKKLREASSYEVQRIYESILYLK